MKQTNLLLSAAFAGATALTSTVAWSAPFSCPQKGGNLIFALEARVPSLDQHASPATATRNIAVNLFESLITRDDKLNPIDHAAMTALCSLILNLDETLTKQ